MKTMKYVGVEKLATVLGAFLLFGLASVAEARQFRLTGNWRQARSAQLNIPVLGGIDHVAGAMVTATGSNPATLTIPANVFVGTNAFVFALPKTTIVQISTMFDFNGPENPGVFQAAQQGERRLLRYKQVVVVRKVLGTPRGYTDAHHQTQAQQIEEHIDFCLR